VRHTRSDESDDAEWRESAQYNRRHGAGRIRRSRSCRARWVGGRWAWSL